MKLESDGILIGLRPLGERDSIALVFTREFGLMRGVMRAAQIAKKNRPLVGQVGAAAWNARLDSQLGAFHWEAEKNLAAPLMMDRARLGIMNSAFALIGAMLPERECYRMLYSQTHEMLRAVGAGGGAAAYLAWEINLLRELGYALDLSRCSGCGATTDLCYLSPRTGRAVCRECGAPYSDRLYHMPVGLDTTMHFVANACAQQGIDIPAARKYLAGL